MARAMGDVEETLAVVRESISGGHALHELQARTAAKQACLFFLPFNMDEHLIVKFNEPRSHGVCAEPTLTL